MNVIIINLLLFLFFVVLPLLSFLRHNRAFRGGAQQQVKASQTRTRKNRSCKSARYRACRRILFRLVFAVILSAPVIGVVFTNLRHIARHAGRPEALCAWVQWVHETVAPSLPLSLSRMSGPRPTDDLEGSFGFRRRCEVYWGVRLLSSVVRLSPFLFLVFALVVGVGYTALFYLDGREYGLQTRHNDTWMNRFINSVKFHYYLPYVNWKCRLVRNYFSLELVASDGPLPLFRYPTRANAEKRHAAQQARHAATDATAGVSACAAGVGVASVDDWDEDERAALAAQAQDADRRSHLPLRQWAASRSDPEDTPIEAVTECTRYLFAAHPHGILPLCALVALGSNVTDRDRILFVDNRPFTAQTSKAAEAYRAAVCSPVEAAMESRVPAGVVGSPSRSLSTLTATPTATLSPLPPASSVFTTTNTRHVSPAAAAIAAFPPAESIGKTTPPPPTPVSKTRPPYARARHYLYDKEAGLFRLLPGRDEAVPPAGTRGPSRTSGFGDRVRIRLHAVVATFPFFIPVMREVYLFHGMLDASYRTCRRVLESNVTPVVRTVWRWRRQARTEPSTAAPTPHEPSSSSSSSPPTVMDYNGLILFPGGASEALLSSSQGPAQLLLRRRKGFVRLALQTGASLVPVYTFGETDYFDQFGTHTWRDAAVYEDDDSTVWGPDANRNNNSNSNSSIRGEDEPVVGSPTRADPPTTSTSGSRTDAAGSKSSATAAASRRRGSLEAASSAVREPPRLVRWFQRVFQDTFGISLPIVKNIFPHRCKAATVVGRPLYFELPSDLAHIYTNPSSPHDVEVERAVATAAQEVYLRELRDLFDTYAPIYLPDHQRRRLVIV